jgi:hypothetical protein
MLKCINIIRIVSAGSYTAFLHVILVAMFSYETSVLSYKITRRCDPRSRPTAFFSGSAVNRTRASRSVAKNSDH